MPESAANTTPRPRSKSLPHSISFKTQMRSLSSQIAGRAVIEGRLRGGALLQDSMCNRAIIRLEIYRAVIGSGVRAD